MSPFELAIFGITPPQAKTMFKEFLEIVLMAWTEGKVNYEGQHYQFKDVHLSLQPYQKPYPPLWYPTSNPESLPWVGEQRLSQLFNYLYADQDAVGGQISKLRAAYADPVRQPGALNAHVDQPTVGVLRHVHVAETDAEAERNVRAAYDEHWDNVQFLWSVHGGYGRHDKMGNLDKMITDGSLIMGSPERVRSVLQGVLDRTGAGYFAGAFSWGGLSQNQALTSIDLFAKQVIPNLRQPEPVALAA